MYEPTKLSAIHARSRWGGFDFVDFEMRGKQFCCYTHIDLILRQNSLIGLATKSKKYPSTEHINKVFERGSRVRSMWTQLPHTVQMLL